MFCDYSMLATSYKIGEVHFRLLGTNGYHVKAKNERFTAAGSSCHFQIGIFTSFGIVRSKKYTKRRAVRGARLFFLI